MTWLPFSVFAVCCVAQFWLVERVASALKARHPQIHDQMYGLFAFNRLFWFAIVRGDRRLNDPDLTARTRQLQFLVGLALASWLAFAIQLMTGRHGGQLTTH